MVVPADALPGAHWITAIGRTTGNASQKQFTVRTDWSQFGWTSRGKRNNRNENVINAENVSRLQELWSTATGGTVGSPVIAGGTVYVSSKDGPLAIDQATGTIKWVSGLGQYASDPTVLNGLVFAWTVFDSRYETEMAFDTATGALVWSNNLQEGRVRFSPATAGRVLYVTEDIAIHALDASTGQILWMTQDGIGTETSAPTIADGIVYVSSLYGKDKVTALDSKTGKTIWQTPVNDLISTPVVASGVVCVATWGLGRGSSLYALNAKTGAVIWALDPTVGLEGSLASAKGILYASGRDGRLYAFRVRTGKLAWSSTPIGGSLSPAVANGVIYTVGSNITALDELTGTVLWSSPSHANFSAPVVADGLVVAGSTDGNVYAYALDGGKAAVYHRSAAPPSYGSLHPDQSLRPSGIAHHIGKHR
jgi:outer membrane protein assembly factor BamB